MFGSLPHPTYGPQMLKFKAKMGPLERNKDLIGKLISLSEQSGVQFLLIKERSVSNFISDVHRSSVSHAKGRKKSFKDAAQRVARKPRTPFMDVLLVVGLNEHG